MKDKPFMLLSGTSHPRFSEEVARSVGVGLGSVQIETFPDGEIGVQILENVRGKDVFVIQSIARKPNHYLMELLILVDALKRASARSIVAVIPYYPYSRQDRKDKGRVPITAKLVADLLQKSGVNRVLAMDLHTDQIQGFFDIPVDNLYARPLFVRAIKSLNIKNGVIVSPDIGSNRMARKFAENLEMDMAIAYKERASGRSVKISAIMGNVKGKQVILVDDICSTGSTLETAAKICRKEGAESVFAAVSHGLFVGESLPLGVDRFFVADSVPVLAKNPKVEIVSAAPLFGEAIDCIVKAKSISSLFKSH